MKKNLLIAALVAVAAIFASCEKQPTAVLPENMGSKVTMTGYVRAYYLKKNAEDMTSKKSFDTVMVKNAELLVLRGTKVGESMTYREYTATTDKNGFYTIELGCAQGQKIDEIKVIYSVYDKTYVIPQGKSDPVKTEAYFYGEAKKENAAAGHAYNLDVNVKAEDYVGENENS